jgi:hypothetical protein
MSDIVATLPRIITSWHERDGQRFRLVKHSEVPVGYATYGNVEFPKNHGETDTAFADRIFSIIRDLPSGYLLVFYQPLTDAEWKAEQRLHFHGD